MFRSIHKEVLSEEDEKTALERSHVNINVYLLHLPVQTRLISTQFTSQSVQNKNKKAY